MQRTKTEVIFLTWLDDGVVFTGRVFLRRLQSVVDLEVRMGEEKDRGCGSERFAVMSL